MSASDLRPVEFPHLGLTLQVRRIPTLLVQDWRATHPKAPLPPTQEIDYGGQKRMESNPAHPAYQAEMLDYDYRIGLLAIDFAIDRGVVLPPDEMWIRQVEELREWAGRQTPPVILPAEDKVVYVSRILLPDLEDLLLLRRAVFERVEPSEESIASAVERFPATLPRP
ncbi:MAG TPA: hypothetical protein VJK02_05080 [Anaerolineales bacterium]|nr:hypothetical protein [Anaerolineales bacterium]